MFFSHCLARQISTWMPAGECMSAAGRMVDSRTTVPTLDLSLRLFLPTLCLSLFQLCWPCRTKASSLNLKTRAPLGDNTCSGRSKWDTNSELRLQNHFPLLRFDLNSTFPTWDWMPPQLKKLKRLHVGGKSGRPTMRRAPIRNQQVVRKTWLLR